MIEEETMRQFQLMSTATTVVASTLHPYYTYSFTVSAVTVGEGPYSQPLSIQTLEDGEKDSYIIMVCIIISRDENTSQFPVVPLSHSELWLSVPLASD